MFCIAALLCLTSASNATGIYNNTGTTAADSIAFKFQYLDSLGQPVAAAADDSVYIIVNYPGGIEAFRDSMVYNDANITASAWEDLSGGESYTLRYAVADVDGTPVQGTYKVTVIANDNSLTLNSPFRSEFQLITETDFNLTLEYIKDLLDSLQNQDNWVAKEASLFDNTSDSVIVNVTSAETANNLVDVIVDANWDEDSTGHFTSPNMAFIATHVNTMKTNVVTADAINANAIGGSEIADDAISSSKLATDAIGSSEMASGAITASTFASNSIAAAAIADNAIDAGAIATDATAEVARAILGYTDTAWAASSFGDQVLDQNDTLKIIEAALDKVRDSIQYLTTATDVNVTSIDANALTAAALAASFVTEILDSLFDTRQVSDTTTGMYLADLFDVLDRVRDSLQYLVTGGGGSAPTVEQIDAELTSNHGAGAWTSGSSGSGAYTVEVWTLDTSGTDEAVPYQSITVQNMAGTQLAVLSSGASGHTTFNLEDSVAIIISSLPAYTFRIDTLNVTANVDSHAVQGYDNPIPAATSASYATVQGYEQDVTGDTLIGAVVEVHRQSPGASVGNASVSASGFNVSTLYKKDTTDSDGLWSFNLLKATEYDDSTQGYYSFICKYGSRTMWLIDTLYITGNVSMPDSIGLR